MNGKVMGRKALYVGRAQKKVEHQAELKRKFEHQNKEWISQYQVRRAAFLSVDEECIVCNIKYL